MTITKYLFLLLIFFFFINCSDTDDDKEKKKREAIEKKKREESKENYIILLDLSDRLLVEGQSERDIEAIKLIYGYFRGKVQEKMFIKSNDAFRIVIAPQVNSKINIQDIQNKLYINLASLKISDKKKKTDEFNGGLEKELKKLYQKASQNKKEPKDFFGADIWRYFNEDLENNLSKDANTQNHLFIITDGYLYFENYDKTLKRGNRHSSFKFLEELRTDNWENKFKSGDYGIITPNRKFPNLNVMVLEINPIGDFLNEYDLIKMTWEKWLKEMDISNIEIQKREPIKNLNEKIGDFLKHKVTIKATKETISTPKSNIKIDKVDEVDSKETENLILKVQEQLNKIVQSSSAEEKHDIANQTISSFSSESAPVKITYQGKDSGEKSVKDYLNSLRIVPIYKNRKIQVVDVRLNSKHKIQKLFVYETRK